jgi:hypothetical protein
MISRHLQQTAFAAIVAVLAIIPVSLPAQAAEEGKEQGYSTVHPVDETKKAAKAVGQGVKKTGKVIGHGFRDGARAIGHGTRKVTRDIGHAFRDGAHELTGKKEK